MYVYWLNEIIRITAAPSATGYYGWSTRSFHFPLHPKIDNMNIKIFHTQNPQLVNISEPQ